MIFKASPRFEIFDLETKQTKGFFDNKGFFETDDPIMIKRIKALNINEYEPKDDETEDEPGNVSDMSKMKKAELIELAESKSIDGADKMTKHELIEALK